MGSVADIGDSFSDTVVTGYVVDAQPAKGNFGIRIPGMAGAFRARGGSSLASYGPGSSLSSHSYSVGTRVLIYLPTTWPFVDAVIIQALPTETEWNEHLVLPVTSYYSWPPRIPYAWRELLEGRPAYADTHRGSDFYAQPGQEGIVYPSGTEFRINMMQAALKAGDKASVEVHILDNFLKLVGFNYTLMSAGSLEHRMADQGEYTEIFMATPYLWEAKGGALSPYPQSVYQYPVLPRYIRLRGYMGDLESEFIQTPNIYGYYAPGQSLGFYGVNYSPGYRLMDIHKGIDGSYRLQSAREITIAKVPLMGALRRSRENVHYRYDPDGGEDTPDYYPAGIQFDAWDAITQYYQLPTGNVDKRYPYSVVYSLFNANRAEWNSDNVGTIAMRSLIAKDEARERWNEWGLNLEHHPAWDFFGKPGFTSESGMAWLQLDHRASARYWDTTSLLHFAEDGTITIQAGSTGEASKITLHPTEGIHLVGPNFKILANGETMESGTFCIGARSFHLSANADIQVNAGGYTELQGDSVIIESPVTGRLSQDRTAWVNPDQVKLQLYSNSGLGWILELEQDVDNNPAGSGSLPLTGVGNISDKVFKVSIEFSCGGVTEYLESPMFFRGGGDVANGVRFRGPGEDSYEVTFKLSSNRKLAGMTYEGKDELGNLLIEVDEECYTLEDLD